MRYVVIPMRPAGTDGWSEEALTKLATRDTLVGVTVPRA
jgi:nitrile hydratase